MFNTFFADQCSMLRNRSKLPATHTLSQKQNNNNSNNNKTKPCESPTTIDFPSNNILKIIRNLDPNKALGHEI